MAVVALASAKGAPGVTTTALTLALALSGPGRLAEARAPESSPAPPPATIELQADAPVTRDWDGRVHAFTFALSRDWHARVVVEQLGADVGLRLSSPSGVLVTEVDGLAAAAGPEQAAQHPVHPVVLDVVPVHVLPRDRGENTGAHAQEGADPVQRLGRPVLEVAVA